MFKTTKGHCPVTAQNDHKTSLLTKPIVPPRLMLHRDRKPRPTGQIGNDNDKDRNKDPSYTKRKIHQQFGNLATRHYKKFGIKGLLFGCDCKSFGMQ